MLSAASKPIESKEKLMDNRNGYHVLSKKNFIDDALKLRSIVSQNTFMIPGPKRKK